MMLPTKAICLRQLYLTIACDGSGCSFPKTELRYRLVTQI